ncbi:MAG: hypothetical protein Q7T74_05425 [Candidatus Saccharibacteria bacterium]|nr:hypothetical protein [Candidatus Saccharibacteria bacterium]
MDVKTHSDTQALNGSWVYSLKISTTSGRRILANRRSAMEFGLFERVLAREHTDYPGVNVIDLFEAPMSGSSSEPIDLRSAMLHNPRAVRFLLSITDYDLAVITSQIRYDASGEFSVDQQSYAPPLPQLNMFDVALCDSHAYMTERHVRQFRSLGGDPTLALPQDKADSVFRAITSSAVEVA